MSAAFRCKLLSPLSPLALVTLLFLGLAIYLSIDPIYYNEKVLFGGAMKYESLTSSVAFIISIFSLLIGVYIGNRRLGVGKTIRIDSEDLNFLRKSSATLVFISIAILIKVQIENGDVINQLLLANINDFKKNFNDNASIIEKLALALRHLILVWGATIQFNNQRSIKYEVATVLFAALLIALFTESRLIVATLGVVLISNYYRTRPISLWIISKYTMLIISFLAIGTMIRVFALEAKFDSDVLEFLMLEIIRYFLTPFGYSLAIIDQTYPNFEYGIQTLLSFFLLSFGKFFGSFDEDLNFTYIDFISPYYYSSLNQIGSVGALSYGFGVPGLVIIYFAIGIFMGNSYFHYRRTTGFNLIIYPIVFASSLDMVRFLSLASGPAPTCMLFVFVIMMAKKYKFQAMN